LGACPASPSLLKREPRDDPALLLKTLPLATNALTATTHPNKKLGCQQRRFATRHLPSRTVVRERVDRSQVTELLTNVRSGRRRKAQHPGFATRPLPSRTVVRERGRQIPSHRTAHQRSLRETPEGSAAAGKGFGTHAKGQVPVGNHPRTRKNRCSR